MNGPQILLALQEAAAGTTAAGATTQPAQASSGTARERFLVTAGSTQRAQTSAGAAIDRFRITAASSQAVQASAGAALERFRVVGASSQAAQSAAGAAAERFLITAGSSQATQATAGVASWEPASTQITGASSQAAQTSAAQAVDRFVVTAASTQASQATSGVAQNGVPVAPPVTASSGAISRRRQPRVHEMFRLEPDWLALQPRPTPIAARAASRQAPQATSGELAVSDPDEWLLLDFEIAA